MDDNFSDEVKQVIIYSKEIAYKFQTDIIDTYHLILAIILHKNNEPYIRFLAEIEDKIKKNFEDHLSNKSTKKEIKEIHLSLEAERALKTTFLEAKLFKDDTINLYHLLLCILRNEADPVTRFLNSNAIYHDGIKEIYKDIRVENEEKATYHILEVKDYTILFKNRNDIEYSKMSFETQEHVQKALKELSVTDLEGLILHSLDLREVSLITRFKKLKELVITNSDLKNINFLEKLGTIEKLKLLNCAIDDISAIGWLGGLKSLDLSNNNISDLSSLSDLTKLKSLNVSHNKIVDIKSLINLIPNKPFLLLGNNKIKEIDEAIVLSFFDEDFKFTLEDVQNLKNSVVKRQKYEKAAFLRNSEKLLLAGLMIDEDAHKKINDIYIEESLLNLPLQSPPLEIIGEGVDDIKAFFAQINKDQAQKYLYEGKLLIIGEGGTGKTSFAKKMENLNSSLPSDKETTFNIDIKRIQYKINDRFSSTMHINMWDFGGQKIYRGTHQLFFSEKCLYVLLDDNREEKTDFGYWLNTVEQLGGDESSLIIVLNQKHGRQSFDFDESGYKSQFGKIIKEIIPLDLSVNDEKAEFLIEMVRLRFRDLPLIGSPLPTSWVDIREKLSTLEQNFISLKDFIDICHSQGINDINTINTLSTYFDNIGVFTHYNDDPLLRERIYLNSNWLVETIYKVIDNQLIDQHNGRISSKQVKEIWGDQDLHFEIDRLCSLMNRFGLMYRIQDSDEFVVPEKLPKKMPYEKWEYTDYLHLSFIYKFKKYIPKGLMSKLIVSLNKYILNQNLVWHRGVNIEYENTHAEIIESYKNSDSFEIRLAGQNKNGLLAIIIEKFDEILSPYKNLSVEKMVQCNCRTCKVDKEPHFFKYSSLLKRREKGVSEIDCEKEYEKINVIELLEGIEKNKNVMKKISIFIACSSELHEDREKFEIFVNRENKKLIDNNIFLELNLWEDFIDSMSKTRLQDEYNKAVTSSNIFISLFSTKVGKYTKEEFETAYKNFLNKGTPKHIYTYFRNTKKGMLEIDKNDFNNLSEFKEKLDELGHFYTRYEDSNDLLRLLKLQFDKILTEI